MTNIVYRFFNGRKAVIALKTVIDFSIPQDGNYTTFNDDTELANHPK